MDAVSQTTFSNAFSLMKALYVGSSKFVPRGPVENKAALVPVMARTAFLDKGSYHAQIQILIPPLEQLNKLVPGVHLRVPKVSTFSYIHVS